MVKTNITKTTMPLMAAMAFSPEANSDDESTVSEEETDTPLPSTVVDIVIQNRKTERNEIFRVLLDTGTNRCMGTRAAVQRAGLRIKPDQVHKYKTAAGTFTTTQSAKIRAHHLLELNSRRILQQLKVQVTEGDLGTYDFIFGQNYMSRYGIDLLFSEGAIQWDGMRMAMKDTNALKTTSVSNTQQEEDDDEHDYLWIDTFDEIWYAQPQHIKDNTYAKADVFKVAKDQKHLTKHQQELLGKLLNDFEDRFQGQLGQWPEVEIGAHLKPGATPFHCGKPIRIPHAHLETLKKEVQRLIDVGVLEEVTGISAGPWCAPSFIVRKKDGKVRFVTDYRELNKRIQRRPWPMPHVADLVQDIGNFTYVTAIDLSMGFYHFLLNEELSKMSTFMLPFGLYRYKRLPMGLCVSPDIFQEHMFKLFADLPWVKVYIDDVLVFSNGSYEDHLEKVRIVLERLRSKNLAVNIEKTYWAVKQVDYLGFKLTPQGVMPQPKKVAAIMRMTPPANKRELRRFIGMVNYYRFMWHHRSHILAPLAELAGKNTPFKWKDKHQQAFQEMKRIVGREVLLSFPDYNQRFQLYVDASDKQLGSVLKQGNKTLAFFSKKLNPAQQHYTVGEKEMLSIVESLKEFRTMIHGYPIDIYTDHLNWTHGSKFIKNARVMRWRLLIQEYAPTIHYIKGSKNVVADTLSRNPFDEFEDDDNFAFLEEAFDMSSSWRKFYQPITIKEIGKAQKTDQYVKSLQSKAPDRLGEFFEDIGKKSGPDKVVTESDAIDQTQRIIVPKSLRKRLMKWYHTTLVHPGVQRLYNTLRQHYTWPKMLEEIRDYIKHCGPCQKGKRGLRGMGKIPLKDVETEPWKDIAVDLAGPWKAMIDNKEVVFWTFTIIDVFTGWVEIMPIETKKSEVITDLFVREWLRRYPRPSRVIFDLGGEFDSVSFRSMLSMWYIKWEPITGKNPRANAIIERMHSVLGDMLRVQIASKHPKEDPIHEMTSAAAYAIRATVHGVTKYTPSQLVYNRDLILRTKMQANVEMARQRREAAISINNARENKRRIAHNYKKGDKILILAKSLDPKLQLHQGPYKVMGYNKATGTLHIQRKNYVEPINIRNVRPFFGKR